MLTQESRTKLFQSMPVHEVDGPLTQGIQSQSDVRWLQVCKVGKRAQPDSKRLAPEAVIMAKKEAQSTLGKEILAHCLHHVEVTILHD